MGAMRVQEAKLSAVLECKIEEKNCEDCNVSLICLLPIVRTKVRRVMDS